MNKDIILKDDNSPDLLLGDFQVDYADDQHIMNILQSSVGMYKQYPQCGVGINRYLNGPITLKDIIDIKSGIKMWGYSKIDLDQSFQNIIIKIRNE